MEFNRLPEEFMANKRLKIPDLNNKVWLYSTGNYIQYPMINHNGKEYLKKECVCVYIYMYNWITLLYGRNKHNIVNQLYFNFKNIENLKISDLVVLPSPKSLGIPYL